jgi:hypothetical protein
MAEAPKKILCVEDDRETANVRPGGRCRVDADMKRMRRFLAYLLPLLAFVLVDHLLGRQLYSFPNDDILSHFGLGLNLATGDFRIAMHHPGFPMIEIAGALAAIFKDASDLNGFYEAGRLVHLAFGVGAAVWMAPLAALARLATLDVALLSLAAISMPTMALDAPLLVSYFPAGILLPPMAGAIYLLATRHDLPRWVAPSLYLVLGFQLFMLFPALVLLAGTGAGLLMLLRTNGAENLPAFLPFWPKSERVARALLFVLLALWCRQFLDALHVPGADLRWIPAAVMALCLVLVPERRRLWWAFLRGAVLPILAGWLIGCNVLVMRWGVSATAAFASKGGASPSLPFHEVWQRADIPRFIAAWHWHLFMVALTAAIALLWLVLAVRRDARQGPLPFVAVCATLTLGLNVLIAADVSFLKLSRGARGFGLESRHCLMMIAPLALLGVVGFVTSRVMSTVTRFVFVVVAALSFADYYLAARTIWSVREATENDLEQTLQAHIATSPGNTVWCLGSLQPRQCAMLHGFNRYRLPESFAKLDRRSLEHGRIRYAVDLASACDAPEACRIPGRDLFIGRSEPTEATADILHAEPDLYIYQLARPWPHSGEAQGALGQ